MSVARVDFRSGRAIGTDFEARPRDRVLVMSQYEKDRWTKGWDSYGDLRVILQAQFFTKCLASAFCEVTILRG